MSRDEFAWNGSEFGMVLGHGNSLEDFCTCLMLSQV